MNKSLSNWLQALTLERLTIFMGIVGQIAPYIQATKIFYLKSAHAVSLIACLIGLASMVCWVAYGIDKNIKPLIITNIFGMIGGILTIAGIIYYDP
jgi:uncharacterized protein with PQ loop repeat